MKRILIVCTLLLFWLVPAAEAEAVVTIVMEQSTASCDSANVNIQGSEITITEAGIYQITGFLENGRITIDAGKKDTVQLVLQSVSIQSDRNAAIYGKQAGSILITLDGSSHLQSTGNTPEEKDSIDAVIYSKPDLTMNGTGTAEIISSAAHAIVSKGTLSINGGTYSIDCAAHGLVGKDAVIISGGTFSLHTGKDGIRSTNTDDSALGNISIQDGAFLIDADGDGLSASGNLQITSGNFQITAGGGSTAAEMKQSDRTGFQGWGFRDAPSEADEASVSTKGIKADGNLMISAGTFQLDCADDTLHAGADLSIQSGDFELRTADDGMHADGNISIENGTIRIPYCYEGLEGTGVTIQDGTIEIEAADDGINAAGGRDASGFRGGDFFGNEESFIEINGGSIRIVSDGDCLDSNGSIRLTGGILDLTCGGYGNTAVDYEFSFDNTGAQVTTNDGSENGNGMMHGGRQNPMFGGGNFRGDQNQADGFDHRRGGDPAGKPPAGRPGDFFPAGNTYQ